MFTNKNLLILIVKNIAISLLVIIITMVTIYFLKKEINNVTSKIALNNQLESELKKRTELFGTTEADAKIIGNNDIQIDNAFVPSNNITEFMSALDTIATNNKTVQIYRFESPIQSSITDPIKLSSVSYSNNLTLNIKGLSNYLKSFENLPYFTKIESFNISSQNKSGWTEPSNITFKAVLLTKTMK